MPWPRCQPATVGTRGNRQPGRPGGNPLYLRPRFRDGACPDQGERPARADEPSGGASVELLETNAPRARTNRPILRIVRSIGRTPRARRGGTILITVIRMHRPDA